MFFYHIAFTTASHSQTSHCSISDLNRGHVSGNMEGMACLDSRDKPIVRLIDMEWPNWRPTLSKFATLKLNVQLIGPYYNTICGFMNKHRV